MHAAYRLTEKDGIAKLKQQAAWLKTEYPDAAASLLEGLEETFTVNRLKLTPLADAGLRAPTRSRTRTGRCVA